MGKIEAALAVAVLLLSSCTQKEHGAKSAKAEDNHKTVYIRTWAATKSEFPPDIPLPSQEANVPENAVPWAGTVSHHLLAGTVIDAWFKRLSQTNPAIDTFFVISPSHYGLSTQTWSLADCTWDCGEEGIVKTNSTVEKALSQKLGVSYDNQVFPCEHGVNSLIPYIAHYYPNATVCVVALFGEPPLNQANAQKLSDVLSPYFDAKGKSHNFLLISTDFAHHGDYEGTVFKDTRTRRFFENPSDSTWIFCGCDNRPGIYALSRFLTERSRSAVLYHTNSYELSNEDENDITSYFFSLFWDSEQ
ncbi:MAG: AmmeMemoRadiSam system protein B [Treponema sp.]|nr:AmmeMemoRadiSam system protein B [Treponema sp.]